MKNTTQQPKLTTTQQQMLRNYNASNKFCLRDCYNSYSIYKSRAEYSIIDEMQKANGYGYKITGYNSCLFSCAYCIDDENGTKLVYHTPTKKYVFYI